MSFYAYEFGFVLMFLASTTLGQTSVETNSSVQLYRGLTITGATGYNYTIQSTADLSQTNWQTLTSLVLPSSPYLWLDESSPDSGQRFYRVTVSGQATSNCVVSLNLYSGLTITGVVGSICSILRQGHVVASLALPRSPYLWLDESSPGTSPSSYQVVTPDPNKWAWVSPGAFVMGSPSKEVLRGGDEIQHAVKMTNGFYMGATLVTQGDYQALMGANPSHFQGNSNLPVDSVSWNDAVGYCEKLTQQQLMAGQLPTGWEYRLPTEAEWEYACRAGTVTAFNFGNAIRDGEANFNSHYEYNALAGDCFKSNPRMNSGATTRAGTYPPNAWGLYDMSGNLWEWCQDWYGAYPTTGQTNPGGPVTGMYRVLRGGCYFYYGRGCRSAARDGSLPADRNSGFGFRVVLAPN